MKVYELNNIPCVYLYPDNLGILGFIFKRRLKKELKKHPELKRQLFRLNWEIFCENFGLVGLIIVFLFLSVHNLWWRLVLLALLLMQIYSSIKESFLKK